jgi:hypothetical protein
MRIINKNDVPNFKDVVEFAQWYVANGMPLLPPEKQEVFVSDDATASCLFRHGRFQFEMYLIHPQPVIPMHEHPGVINLEIPANDVLLMSDVERLKARVQTAGQPHGTGFKERAEHSGFVLFSAQQWDEGLEMSTIGARWKGYTAGKKHEELIKRFNPDCLIYPGYADVTRKQQVVEIL